MSLCKKCQRRLWLAYLKRVLAMSGSPRSGFWGGVALARYRFRIRFGWCRHKKEGGS